MPKTSPEADRNHAAWIRGIRGCDASAFTKAGLLKNPYPLRDRVFLEACLQVRLIEIGFSKLCVCEIFNWKWALITWFLWKLEETRKFWPCSYNVDSKIFFFYFWIFFFPTIFISPLLVSLSSSFLKFQWFFRQSSDVSWHTQKNYHTLDFILQIFGTTKNTKVFLSCRSATSIWFHWTGTID